jgi:hypothetical protein
MKNKKRKERRGPHTTYRNYLRRDRERSTYAHTMEFLEILKMAGTEKK